MTSALKLTLLAGTASLLAMLGATQAAQAGGFGHDHFGSYLMGGLNDETEMFEDADEDDGAAAAVAAATASKLLGADDETAAVTGAAAAASVLLDDGE